MLLRLAFCLVLLAELVGPNTALASPLYMKFTGDMSDDDYKELVVSIANPTRYAFVAPPETTGYKVVEVGGTVSIYSPTDKARAIAQNAILEGKDLPSSIFVPRGIASMGLAQHLEISGSFGFIPYSRFKLVGIGAQMNFINGPVPLPSVSARVGYNAMFGGNELTSTTTNIEVVGGLAYAMIDPYMGVGFALSNASSSWKYKDSVGNSHAVSKRAEWSDVYLLVGTRVLLLPLFTVGLEANFSSIHSVFLAKIAVGL